MLPITKITSLCMLNVNRVLIRPKNVNYRLSTGLNNIFPNVFKSSSLQAGGVRILNWEGRYFIGQKAETGILYILTTMPRNTGGCPYFSIDLPTLSRIAPNMKALIQLIPSFLTSAIRDTIFFRWRDNA